MDPWVIGVDLGATKVAVGLVAPDSRIIARRRFPTGAPQGPSHVVEGIVRAVRELEAHLPRGAHVAGLGICSPGPLDHVGGVIIDPPNLPGWSSVPMRQLLAERLEMPVCLEHDAKAAALGEYHFGAARGARDMVYVVVGTGVGAAIIIDGRLYRGRHNSAGEVGHITIALQGARCSCGSCGCVETFLSGPHLGRAYAEAAAREGLAAPAVDVTGETVARLAEKGDPLALEVMGRAGEALGTAVASLAMILDIDLYVIGGSVAKAGELLLAPARQAICRHSFRSVSEHVRIVQCGLGDDGPILGCALLARLALCGVDA